MCVAGLPTSVARLDDPIDWLPVVLWQVEQAVAATTVWFIATGVAKLMAEYEWHASHEVEPVEMCPVICSFPAPPVTWQPAVRQLPAAGGAVL